MREMDITVELKALRLHGMAGAWSDLETQGGNAAVDASRWLITHLLEAESTDRVMRSVSHQIHAAKFPVHRDLAGFDFDASPVDRKLVMQLAETTFTEQAHNAVLVGGPGEDDHRHAGSIDAPLPHHRNGQRVASLPTQHVGGQEAHQGT